MLLSIRWLIRGLAFGILTDIALICATDDWQHWQTPGSLAATIVIFATFGLMTGIVHQRLARS